MIVDDVRIFVLFFSIHGGLPGWIGLPALFDDIMGRESGF